MNPIKVKSTEKHEGRLVCRGKLVFIKSEYKKNCITGYYGINDGKGNLKLTDTGYMGDYFITPIIVSDIEEINIGDKFFWRDKIFTLLESDEGKRLNDFKSEGKKILVPFEKLSYEFLHNITCGIYKDWDEVFIECEKILDGFDNDDNELWRFEVLLNYVNVFPIKKPRLVVKGNMYSVTHKQFATDRFEFGTTIVEADSKENAMKKLNEYLATEPDGVYTSKPCDKIEYVSELEYLS